MRLEDPFPSGARYPVLADLDGNGLPDLAAAGSREIGEGSYAVLGEVYWSRNRGDGTLEEATVLRPVEHAGGILAEDLDRDGDADMVVRDYHSGEDGTRSAVAVLINRGDGTFLDGTSYPVGLRPMAPISADLDGDGALDLVVLNALSNDLSVLWNGGDGTYRPMEPLPTGISGGAREVRADAADVDRDGDTDLVVAASYDDQAPGEIAVLQNEGDRTFRTTVRTIVSGYLYTLRTADLDANGLPEVLVCVRNSSSGLVSVLENLGDGEFKALGAFDNGFGGSDLEVRDIDGDLDPDLVMRSYYGAQVLENVTGNERFQLGCDPFLRGDVNADGVVSFSDLVMLRRFLFSGQVLSCWDAANATDDEVINVTDAIALLKVLFLHGDWTLGVPAPSAEPGLDPTTEPWRNALNQGIELHMDARLGMQLVPGRAPEETDDLIRLGEVSASPGAEVLVPVYLTSSVPVEAVQLVLRHDPAVLEILPDSLSFGGTIYEELGSAAPPFGVPEVAVLTVHPEAGVATAVIAGRLIYADRQVPPGVDTLIAWVRVRVSSRAVPGTTLTLDLTNGEDDRGVGPYKLRNEITFEGNARLVTTLPILEGAVFQIVMDQIFMRGDSNSDSELDLSDPVSTLGYLFGGQAEPTCLDAADADDSGELEVTDAIYVLNFLFLGGPSPPSPSEECAFDPTTDGLSCRAHAPCEGR